MNDRIKELRKALGMSQEELGGRLGVTNTAISGYESGRRNLTDQMVISICREFNVNENWLRTGEGEMFLLLDKEDELAMWAGSLLNPNNENEFMKKFVHMLSKLDVNDWKILEKMALLMESEHKKD